MASELDARGGVEGAEAEADAGGDGGEQDLRRRLHPSSLLFSFFAHFKTFALPALLFVFFASGYSWQRWVAILLVPAMLFEFYRFFSLRYVLTGDELVVTDGVLWKNERRVPFARIQNLDTVQNPLHRLFRVAEVRVETGGGTEPEAVLRVLGTDDVERLRAHVLPGTTRSRDPAAGDDAGAAAAADDEREVVALSTGDLLRLGLDPGRGVALAAVLVGLAWEFELDVWDWGKLLVERVVGDSTLLFAVLVLVAGVALLVLLSMVGTFLRLWAFRLTTHGDEYRVVMGFPTRHTATLPRRRIQLVAVRESLVLRWQRRRSVLIETAGGGQADSGDSSVSRKWFAPLLTRPRVAPVIAPLVDGADPEALDWRPLGPRGRYRMRRAAELFALAFTLGFAVLLAVRSTGAMSWLPYTALVAVWVWLMVANVIDTRDAIRRYAHALTDAGLWIRRGGFTRWAVFVPWSKIQAVTVRESPFDRRHAMRKVVVDTAGAGVVDVKVAIALPRDDAETLRETILERAERGGFVW